MYSKIAAVVLFLATVHGAALPSQNSDLASCMAKASAITEPVAAEAWAAGCQVRFNPSAESRKAFRSLMTRDADDQLAKRECNQEAYDNCTDFCDENLSCPECAAGCYISCQTQYGCG